jgi:pilus assembly protein CpaC
VPFWGDLPIIGRTGGLDKTTSSEQEIVVLVTPLLVHPLDRCNTPPIPGSDVYEPGDIEFYLLGHLEGRRSEDYRASVRNDFARQERYIHCNDQYIIGPRGTTYGCCKPKSCACPTTAPATQDPVVIPEPAVQPDKSDNQYQTGQHQQ